MFALASVRGSADIQFPMKVCLDVVTLVESATPQLKEIAEVAASFKDPNTDEACVAFAPQVSMLEGSLKQTFRGAGLRPDKLCARKE